MTQDPAPLPRFGWLMRLFLTAALAYMFFRSTDVLYPWNAWVDELAIERLPQALPTRQQLAESSEPGAELRKSLASLPRYWCPWPTQECQAKLEAPSDCLKYGVGWTLTRLEWCEVILGLNEEWPMFSPEVSRRKYPARARLFFADGTEITVRQRCDVEDYTHYLRWYHGKNICFDFCVLDNGNSRREACVGYANYLTHQHPVNEAGAPLTEIQFYHVRYDFPAPDIANPRAFLIEQMAKTRDHQVISDHVYPTFFTYWPATRRMALCELTMENHAPLTWWSRFWHQPVRAERLALMRILLGLSLLTQQLIEFLPYLMEYYGPEGVAPAGLQDDRQLRCWYWTMLLFNTDDPATIGLAFALWMAVTAAFTAGFCTRFMNVALWLLTMAFLARNYLLQNGGDSVLQNGVFLLMLAPSGRALSVDAWLRRRRGLDAGPVFTPAWPVRLIQIQLCVLYCTTGLVKLKGTGLFQGMWWDGTSLHYTFNYLTMNRYPYVSLPIPLWVSMPMTYAVVWWETLFPLLMLSRWTRRWTLGFGILMHLGIFISMAIGWFSLFTLSFYGVWVPDEFWRRRDARG